MVAWLRVVPRHLCSFGPRLPHLVLLLLILCLRENIDCRKILAPSEFRKVPETKKYTKQGLSVLQSYKPMKGDQWKIPINQLEA
jgi:hypothetical protein